MTLKDWFETRKEEQQAARYAKQQYDGKRKGCGVQP